MVVITLFLDHQPNKQRKEKYKERKKERKKNIKETGLQL